MQLQNFITPLKPIDLLDKINSINRRSKLLGINHQVRITLYYNNAFSFTGYLNNLKQEKPSGHYLATFFESEEEGQFLFLDTGNINSIHIENVSSIIEYLISKEDIHELGYHSSQKLNILRRFKNIESHLHKKLSSEFELDISLDSFSQEEGISLFNRHMIENALVGFFEHLEDKTAMETIKQQIKKIVIKHGEHLEVALIDHCLSINIDHHTYFNYLDFFRKFEELL